MKARLLLLIVILAFSPVTARAQSAPGQVERVRADYGEAAALALGAVRLVFTVTRFDTDADAHAALLEEIQDLPAHDPYRDHDVIDVPVLRQLGDEAQALAGGIAGCDPMSVSWAFVEARRGNLVWSGFGLGFPPGTLGDVFDVLRSAVPSASNRIDAGPASNLFRLLPNARDVPIPLMTSFAGAAADPIVFTPAQLATIVRCVSG